MRKILVLVIMILSIGLSGCGTAKSIGDLAQNQDNGNDGYDRDEKKHSLDYKINRLKEIEPVPEFSDKYLVGIDLGGSSWGEYYECIDARVVVCTNHDILIYMPTRIENHNAMESGVIATLTLTDEQYDNIVNAVDKPKLFLLDPDPDIDTCDGSSYGLILYGADDEYLKFCGDYEPRNDDLCDMIAAVRDNLPYDEIMDIREEQIDKLREMDD